MDMLALLNWTLPELNAVMPESLPRLTIFSAGDPMWRGGLSAPASMFIHSGRPLISENATSTLVHEVFHVAMGVAAANGFDWIVEGLAEYYSLDLLQRGGAITARRYQRALEKQTQWASEAEQLCGDRSSGATTALAVVTFRQLDQEIRRKSSSKLSLDNVVAELAHSHSRVSLDSLQEIIGELLQEASVTLNIDNLPGCQQFQAAAEA
jgi:predicted metalloprotease with PDZ domain